MFLSSEDVLNVLEPIAMAEMEKLFHRVPFARDFHQGAKTHLAYYRRHLLETVVRMRLDIQTDAYCLYKMRPVDNKLSQLFARYLSEEAGHDNLFLRDVEMFGINKQEALQSKPLDATENLIGYFYYCINHEGPLLTVLWGWFVEWYSDRFNKVIAQRAAAEFGAEKLKGSFAHLVIDGQEDHSNFMLKTLSHAIQSQEDVMRAQRYLRRVIGFLEDYFRELFETTIGQEAKAA